MTSKPAGEPVLIFDINQVHGVLLVDLVQAKGMRRRGGIGGVDPFDEGLLVAKDQGCAIEHDRCAVIIWHTRWLTPRGPGIRGPGPRGSGSARSSRSSRARE